MKVSELIEQLRELDPEGEVVVQLWGGLRGGCTTVTGASNGFDWFHGKAVIDTEKPVMRFEKQPRDPLSMRLAMFRVRLTKLLVENDRTFAEPDDKLIVEAVEKLVMDLRGK